MNFYASSVALLWTTAIRSALAVTAAAPASGPGRPGSPRGHAGTRVPVDSADAATAAPSPQSRAAPDCHRAARSIDFPAFANARLAQR